MLALARHFDLTFPQITTSPDDLVCAIRRLPSPDQPFGNSSVVRVPIAALRTRADGFTRMLAAMGAMNSSARQQLACDAESVESSGALPRSLRKVVLLETTATEWVLFNRVPGFKQLGGCVRHSRVSMRTGLCSDSLHHFGEEMFDSDFLRSVDPGDARVATPPPGRTRRGSATAKRHVTPLTTGSTPWPRTIPKVREPRGLANISVRLPVNGSGAPISRSQSAGMEVSD